MPERQYTLRATVEWSVGLLDDAERSLLETVAVFVDGWTVEAAGEVAGLDEDRALDLTEALAGHSLIYLDLTDHGPRSRMLETIRTFVTERLAARTDVAEIQRRHADYYRELAEQADRPLRHIGHREWLELLQAEAGNLAATVQWYLDNDRAPLPHLFRVLWPFWALADHMDEARTWADQLLPAADSLDPQARGELVWTALVTALDVGDDAAALVARERLEPLLAGIRDPFLHALSQLATAWTAPLVDDFDGALQGALVSLEELRGQDEPFWTIMTLNSLGGLEMVADRDDEAFGHLNEARDLAERFDNAWLAAWSRSMLGTLAVRQGRLDEARALLDEALALSMGAHSTSMVTLCLAAFARLSFAEGDAERAGLLVAAADGLRHSARAASLATAAADGGRAGDPDPASAGGGPVRPGVRRRHAAQAAGGRGCRRRQPPRQHPGTLSRGQARPGPDPLSGRRYGNSGGQSASSEHARVDRLPPQPAAVATTCARTPGPRAGGAGSPLPQCDCAGGVADVDLAEIGD
jgi:hypothetical protein